MKLTSNPRADLISYVERIQRRLSRHQASLLGRNEAFFDAARAIAREHSSEADSRDRALLPDSLQGSFGLLDPEEFMRRVEEAAGMSTAFQNAAALFQLLNLWYDVAGFVGGVSGHYGHDDTSVFLATVPHWSHNARAFRHSPTGVHIIVFYDRLFELIRDVSLALPLSVLPPDLEMPDISLFPSLATELFDTKPPSNAARTCLQSFLKRHGDYDFTPSPEIGPPSESIRLLVQDIELSMQAFLIGHEIAHVLCGHEGESRLWNFQAADGEKDTGVTENVQSRDQEYEADYVGFKLGRGATLSSQIPLATYACSVLLFFSANEWLMRLHHDDDDLSEEEAFRVFGAHPPFSTRRQWIIRIAETGHPEMKLDLRLLENLERLYEEGRVR